MNDDEKLMDDMYYRFKHPVRDGSLQEAIRTHSQVCGLIAYLFNVHPDTVARTVAEAARARRV